jgi:altronate dehydratase
MDVPGFDPCSATGQVASGRQSKSEELGYGGAEFVPWQIGAVM